MQLFANEQSVHVVGTFIQSCASQSLERHPVQLSPQRMSSPHTLSWHHHLSPVQPVHLWKLPNRCFFFFLDRSTTFTVFFRRSCPTESQDKHPAKCSSVRQLMLSAVQVVPTFPRMPFSNPPPPPQRTCLNLLQTGVWFNVWRKQ